MTETLSNPIHPFKTLILEKFDLYPVSCQTSFCVYFTSSYIYFHFITRSLFDYLSLYEEIHRSIPSFLESLRYTLLEMSKADMCRRHFLCLSFFFLPLKVTIFSVWMWLTVSSLISIPLSVEKEELDVQSKNVIVLMKRLSLLFCFLWMCKKEGRGGFIDIWLNYDPRSVLQSCLYKFPLLIQFWSY